MGLEPVINKRLIEWLIWNWAAEIVDISRQTATWQTRLKSRSLKATLHWGNWWHFYVYASFIPQVAGAAVTRLHNGTHYVQNYDHVDTNICEWTAGHSLPCRTDWPISAHPLRLRQTILLFFLASSMELSTSQYPLQFITRYLQVKSKDIFV